MLSGRRKSNPPNQYVNEISSGREKDTAEEASGVGGCGDEGAVWVRAGREGSPRRCSEGCAETWITAEQRAACRGSGRMRLQAEEAPGAMSCDREHA